MSTRLALSNRAKQHLLQWYDEDTLTKTPVVTGSMFGRIFGATGQHAVTINQTVNWAPGAPDLDSDVGIGLLGHELYHVVDQREMGWWGYLARYLWAWRPSHIKNGRSHPMEAPAYARGREILDAL